jgi:hypothetical protein
VYQFTEPSDSIQLLRWNKELPSASAADPLGLNLRVSARLANELLHCITSITPRARYYCRRRGDHGAGQAQSPQAGGSRPVVNEPFEVGE